MKKLIVIADWAADTLTCQEVRTAVEGFLQDPTHPNIHFVSSTPSTIHTAFLTSQIVEIEERYGRPLDTVIFVNTDVRSDSTNPHENSQGSNLFIIRLKSGLHLLGPNAEYTYSFIKDKTDVVFEYSGLQKGGQFRSRDVYSRVAAHVMDNLIDELELEETHTNLIPEFSHQVIGHIDNYGNIKTNIRESSFKEKYNYGDEVSITINGSSQKALFIETMFGGKQGELVIYPGSSGAKEDPFLEISIWTTFNDKKQTSVLESFNNPLPGAKIEIS